MEWQGTLQPLFWLLFVMFTLQIMLKKVKLPAILIYILVGIVISYTHIWPYQDGQINWLNGVSQFGLYYLMFLSGLEIDVSLLRFKRGSNRLNNPLVVALLIFLGTMALAFLIGLRIHQIDPAVQTWMIMLILLTTSLGIVMPVLKDNGVIHSYYGQILLTSAILADLVTVIVLSVLSGSYQSGLQLRSALVGILIPVFMISFLVLTKVRSTVFWKKQIREDSLAKLQGVLAIIALYGIFTDLSGSEPILGSFLAGLLLSNFMTSSQTQLKNHLELLGYGFLIPVFFVMVGYNFKLDEFLANKQSWAWVPILTAAAYVVKLVPMLCLGPMLGFRKAIAGGFLLSSRLTLIVVAASIGTKLGVVPREVENAILVVAIITSVFSPILFTLGQSEIA
ncbi:cation:proton antiporter [Paenibacillus aestuarii]|uniref:Cation:proton antiporter n=1 Tax=Paenibacillus aestuarii TaxID=516965 RepID=A0ABW0K9G8_9BACL|nr:cation:proton antiporter [Paenibacillus aestuarii]